MINGRKIHNPSPFQKYGLILAERQIIINYKNKECGRFCMNKLGFGFLRLPQKDGQIVMGTRLFHICRREIHRNSSRWKPHPTGFCCSAHPLPGFLNRGIRQTDDIKIRQAIGAVAFHRHLTALDAMDTQSMHAANHKINSLRRTKIPVILHHNPFPGKTQIFFCPFNRNGQNLLILPISSVFSWDFSTNFVQ